MRRLVYAPRVYAYVKTDHQKEPFNLSPYVVSGSIQRKVNMVSNASLTIRNPNMMFTRSARTKDGPFFRPMDKITIWLERIRGFPVQVFTGYLDQAPYLQLYPGTTEIVASCTLKRLLHIYWDPALSFTSEFMLRYGWVNKDGQLENRPAQAGENTPGQEKNQPKVMQDGSIGLLLYAVLTEIADWPDKAIHIEELPDDLIKTVTDMFLAYQDDAKEMKEKIGGFLKDYIGTAALGSGFTSSPGSLKGGDNIEKAYNFFRESGFTAEQSAGAIGSIRGESVDLDPKISELSGGGGYGICQWTDTTRKGRLLARPDHDTLQGQLNYIMFELKQNGGTMLKQFKQQKTVEQACNWWTWEYERPAPATAHYDKRLAWAREIFASWGGRPVDREEGSSIRPQTGTAVKGSGKDPSGRHLPLPKQYITEAGYNTWADTGHFGHTHAGSDFSCPNGTPIYATENGKVHHKDDPGGYGTYIQLETDSGPVVIYGHLQGYSTQNGKKVKKGDKIGLSNNSGHSTGPHLHFEIQPDLTSFGSASSQSPKRYLSGATSEGEDADAGEGGLGATGEDVQTAAKAAAFVQAVEFPGFMEQQEAMRLTGSRSLMNDKPIYPFIEQLSKAALRDFQSLPNGDFYAFYPDYFGHMRHRQPYWQIDDIEVLDMQIQLSDETLFTHVFGVGDVTAPRSQGIDWFDRLFSTGVVNIGNVRLSGFNPDSNDETKRKNKKEEQRDNNRKLEFMNNTEEVLNFLKKYGARPHVEEAPFVRSPFFEVFIAWQQFNLLWSRQFATTAQVTFMPELFPGGLVEFKDHDLQVYVESVTHTFDYEAGFTTEMEISAPAQRSSKGNADDPLSFGLVRSGG